jgi:hypothetical protein
MLELPPLGLSPEEWLLLVGLCIQREQRFRSVVINIRWKMGKVASMPIWWVPLWHLLLVCELSLVCLVVLFFALSIVIGGLLMII